MKGPDTLHGRKWRLRKIILDGIPVDDVELAGAYMILGMDGRAHGYGGCNRFSGSYAVDGKSIMFGPMASTRMYCEDSMAVEDALFAALGLVTSLTIENGMLVMRSENGSAALVFEEHQPAP